MSVRVLFFASLRDAAGCDAESIEGGERDLAALYEALRERHRFALARERIRVAVNGAFVPWDRAIADGDEIAFLPPVSGG